MTTTHIVAAHKPDANTEKRSISGLVLPFNRPGYTSAGTVTVNAGAVAIPEDLSRVKLLRDHSTEDGFTPVGYATAAEVTEDGLRMSFKIGRTDDGDTALADVTEHIRDALSVELINTSVDDGVLTAGELTAVALVPIPAFADARVDLITAALSDEQDDEDTAHGENDETPSEDNTDTDTAADEQDDEDDETVHTSTENDTDTNQEDTMTAAHAPAGIHAAKPKHIDFDGAVRAISDLAAGRRTPELTAALEDITYSGQPATRAPQWLGELWDGVAYTREIVPTMTQKPLTSLEVKGWRWKKKPEVDDYEGDKKAIPTNAVETEAIDSKAKRLAAGWDFDRAYLDFNDTEFLKAFFDAAREDYALKTDQRAAEAIVKWSMEESTLAPSAQPDLLHAAAHARQLIKTATRVEPTAFLVHPDDMFALFDITMLDIPQFLELLGVDPKRFISTPLAKPGQVVAYTKPAVQWFELAGSPIRVNAQHIANGGIDEALFGYYDALLINPAGVVSVPIAESAGTVEAAE